MEADEARKALAPPICERIHNHSYMVIVTKIIARSMPYPRRGSWDVDEPAPARLGRCRRRRDAPKQNWGAFNNTSP